MFYWKRNDCESHYKDINFLNSLLTPFDYYERSINKIQPLTEPLLITYFFYASGTWYYTILGLSRVWAYTLISFCKLRSFIALLRPSFRLTVVFPLGRLSANVRLVSHTLYRINLLASTVWIMPRFYKARAGLDILKIGIQAVRAASFACSKPEVKKKRRALFYNLLCCYFRGCL